MSVYDVLRKRMGLRMALKVHGSMLCPFQRVRLCCVLWVHVYMVCCVGAHVHHVLRARVCVCVCVRVRVRVRACLPVCACCASGVLGSTNCSMGA